MDLPIMEIQLCVHVPIRYDVVDLLQVQVQFTQVLPHEGTPLDLLTRRPRRPRPR